MRWHHRVRAFFLVFLFLWTEIGSELWAQNASPTPQELDQLLSPIALYPDTLLSQIMTASTNPQEILDVDNWLSANPGLSGTALTDTAQQQGFDPAFIALVNFPQVLATMAEHVDDYAAIGEAFSQDQGAVTDSIQRLRAQAYAAGTLRSNAQQTVQVQQAPGQTVYAIQPANPQVVYVPQYDPTVVYVRPMAPMMAPSLIGFGAGITIGALLVNQPWGWGGWGWNWGAHRVFYNRAAWGGWARPYRAPRVWYRPRPIVWANRPGLGGNWRYRPPNYRAPRSGFAVNRPGYARPPFSPNNRPGFRAGVNRGMPSARTGSFRPNTTLFRGNPNPPRQARPQGQQSGRRSSAQPRSRPSAPRQPNRTSQPARSSPPQRSRQNSAPKGRDRSH